MSNLESFNEIDMFYNLEESDTQNLNNLYEYNSQNLDNLEINNSKINDKLGELSCNVKNQNESIQEDNENKEINKEDKNNEEKNDINNILKILDDDDFYNPNKNPKINNKYLDSIIDNLLFMENDFIQDIKKKNFLNNNIYPEFNNIFNLYYSKYKENINSINSKKYILYFFNFIYCLIILYILIGWMSPYQLLVYYIIFSTVFLIIFENKYNHSPLQLIIKYFFNKNFDMIPISYHIFKKTIIIFILISFIGLLKKEYSVFSLLKNIINNLSKYH